MSIGIPRILPVFWRKSKILKEWKSRQADSPPSGMNGRWETQCRRLYPRSPGNTGGGDVVEGDLPGIYDLLSPDRSGSP